ncbi:MULTISPECIES: SGNH/GDSL hydrolase family protein [Streptococcus]|uniref:Lysophospholipase L1-like esterase n=1 Tax=Streptococcus porcorum TaxID=701526 RepID=A0ABV2JGR1_9STRE|nr:SGNH/GDSL hydrolase family protein [Streptococcus sp.]MDY3824374.1 SGNH/GDSL hydrolase family protein [Streptococcus sp.]
MKLEKQDRIVFFGDSITEWGRDKEDAQSLGYGYVHFVASHLLFHYPDYRFEFFNCGIGGDKVADLNARIHDCLDLHPTVLVLMVGINDVWHNVGQESFGSQTEQDRFEGEYRKLLTSLVRAGLQRILVLEPFVLPYPMDRQEWRVDLDPKLQIIRRLVKEFGLEFVALDGFLNEQAILYSAQYYTGDDGVHPTLAGATVIGHEVLKRLIVSEV